MKVRKIKFLGARVMAFADLGDVYIVLSAGKLHKSITFKQPTKRKIKQAIACKWERFVDVTTRRAVYFYESGTDCDGVSSGSPVKYSNIFKAEQDQDEAYNWADGPLYFSRITKAEYAEAKSYRRDHGMEAYEDGHPHSLHI